ncbi:MBOAT family O-acyltransferase [Psychroflexus salinarum]|uniref:MBOAT family O-acyltransferase n=1 Tax=Psychroflexus salinarum TaxID=546024 RepID=A0ABW3GS00_9FLAO
MLFNSLDFAIFLPIVFILYWFVLGKNIKGQNLLLALSSYVFYAWWDWRFLSLILFSSLVDYFVGLQLSKTDDQNKRKLLLWISVLVNLGFLGFFKYFNFFIENFSGAFSLLGYEIPTTSLNIILPVGISFYTFQTLSYTIDVYKRILKPTRDFIGFSAFVSFFPQLVAGPIERATNLLPQFYNKRKFDYAYAVLGMRQILWGLFKKIVIADNCARYANEIFTNYAEYNSSTLILGALFFTFQIYGDFSGYSDIAIGVSRLFGFKLMKNFAFPYFSRDIGEFWRRWHISLSTWFRDYLYIPLGGSRVTTKLKVRNIFIIFLVSGFWHGANWTFIIWGGLNAVYFLPLMLTNKNRTYTGDIAENASLPSLKELKGMFVTFILTVFAWIFFRAENLSHALNFIGRIFTEHTFSMPSIRPTDLFVLLFVFFLVEWVGRKNEFAIEKLVLYDFNYLKYPFYIIIFICIFVFQGSKQEFIYFQF